MTAPLPPNCNLCGLLPGACQCTPESTELTRLWMEHNESEQNIGQIRQVAMMVGTYWTTLVEMHVSEDAATDLTGAWFESQFTYQHGLNADEDGDSDGAV